MKIEILFYFKFGSCNGLKNYEFSFYLLKIVSIVWLVFHSLGDFLYFLNGFVFVFHIEIFIDYFFNFLN